MKQSDIEYINEKAKGRIVESITFDEKDNSIIIKFTSGPFLRIFTESISQYIKREWA
jgi:hypothetical protein